MNRTLVLLLTVLLSGCSPSPPPETASAPAESPADQRDAIFASMPDEVQARYQYRHPAETLEFFGIRPGMTVVEALPGGGWYSRLLVPYLGENGRLIGANYAHDMWPKFGFFDQAFIDSMATWTTDWPQQAEGWKGEDGAVVEAFEFGSMPAELAGQADAVLLIRALHNLARFENDGGHLTAALDDVQKVLKPGGIVGVVQHEARPEMPDEWASGASGYLKKQFVIDRLTAAGFEFVTESDINENPNDQPTAEDVVWRLPPSLMTSRENPELRAEMNAIGESNRMTLKFRKPE
jgi:predicted methyltransferase